jgi:hypothetical protein
MSKRNSFPPMSYLGRSVQRPIDAARTLAYRLCYANTKARIGTPTRVVVVKETISEKANRVWRECDRIMCVNK